MPETIKYLRMNDAELVRRAQNGCSQALTALVRNHQRELRAFLVRRVGNLTAADDLAQEVFLSVIRQIEQIEDDRRFRAWLFKVARNKAVDYIRRLARERTQHREIESLTAEQNLIRTRNSSDSEHELVLTTLQQCIAKLNPQSRALIEAYYVQNLSAEKIASTSNRKGSAVRMSLLRIRTALAGCIRRQLGTEFEL